MPRPAPLSLLLFNPPSQTPAHFPAPSSRRKIYNLCSEREYKASCFKECERFPFDDHNPCALDMIGRFCSSVQSYLGGGDDNTVAIHCKAGKGRTGLMISCLLMHLGICKTADEVRLDDVDKVVVVSIFLSK